MFDKLESWAKRTKDNQSGDLSVVAIEITVFLIIVGYVLAPIGLTAMQSVNTTAAGVSTGTNNTIWTAIVPLVLAALILGVIYFVKHRGK